MKRIFIIMLFIIIGCKISLPEGEVRVSGSIEGTLVTISSKVNGEVTKIFIHEGMRIKKGKVLAQIDQSNLEIMKKEAIAQLEIADAKLRLIEKGARIEDRKQAKSKLEAARATLNQVKADLKRIKELRAKKTATEKQWEDLQSLYKVRLAQYQAAEQSVNKIERGARREEKEIARSNKVMAQANLSLIEKHLNDCIIKAPRTGIISDKMVEEGELVTVGRDLFSIIDLKKVKLKVYIPEKLLPNIRLGQTANITIDGTSKTFSGKVTFISQIAEFTPKTIQTRDERVKLVYAVEITCENNDEQLKSGMPADAVFKIH